MASIAVLLLAAGESTRMGELKALLQWQDKTLIEHQVTALASAGVSRTIVVLGHQSERLESLLKDRAGVYYVYNPDYRQGKTTSIKAGLRALKSPPVPPLTKGGKGKVGSTPPEEAILVLNVDQPRSASTIRQVMELHLTPLYPPLPRGDLGGSSPGRTFLITIPTYRGKGGHPVILSTSLMAELMDISEDALGLKAVVRKHEGETQRVEIDSPEILLDLNTPQDYHKALEMFVSE